MSTRAVRLSVLGLTSLASVAPGLAVAGQNPPRDDTRAVSTPTSDLAVAQDRAALTSSPTDPHQNPSTLGLSLQLAPLETFPRWGVNFDALYALNARFRLGLDGQALLPDAYGDVTRSGFNVNAQAQLTLLNAAHVRWYVTGGVGVGVFYDDYVSRSAFGDQTSVGFGVKLGTGAEFAFFENAPFVVFLEPQVRSYRTRHAVDDEWAEVNLGVRWRLP